MIRNFLVPLRKRWEIEKVELLHFLGFIFFYSKRHILTASYWFEKHKNRLVKLFLTKRGRYNRPFLHITTMVVLVIGVFMAPLLADTYPLFSPIQTKVLGASADSGQQSITVGDNVFQTDIAQKPRDSIITYTVEKGDSLSSIAKKFQISEDTIRWDNDLSSDTLSVGDQLKILPVTGIAYKVQSGDTIYTIAKKFHTDPQPIVDFPFNEFADNETFALVTGQTLIVPNGSIQAAPAVQYASPEEQIYHGAVPAASGGYAFPILGGGLITQFPSWYHIALDIASPIGTPIVAAHSGTVSKVSVGSYDYGYGNNVYIDDGDGISTHYAHCLSIAVSVGQSVVGGQTIVGYIGMSGHTTGPHVHFEVLRNGVLVDPTAYVGVGH